MPLIVLHCNGNKHEGTLDEDVKNMGTRYGNVTHVLQSENLNNQFPSPGQEQVIHILSHGGADHVCDMSASTFNSWMVKAFKMNLNKALNQTYFIDSCDVAKGGTNLLSGLAEHVAKSQYKNRTFIGTVSENGVVKTASAKGKVLVQTTGAKLQDLGLGWKGYRTLFKSKAVISEKMPETEVQQAVVDLRSWT